MMADRCDIAVAPGQPYIEVEHDYEYTSKDRVVTIKHGECYLLVKKTNEDWWQVRKEENSKPFYVPAQYVREVRRALMPPPKPLPNAGSGVGTRGGSVKSRPSALELKQSDENLNKRSPAHSPSAALQPPKEDKCSLKSPIQPGGQVPLNVKHGSLPRTRAKSPLGLRAPLDLDGDSDGEGDKERSREGMQDRNEYRTGNGERERKKGGERADDGDKGRRREGEKVMDGDKKRREGERTTDGGRAKKGEGEQDTSAPREVLEKNLNDSESGDELSSSSTEQLQGRPDSPVYTNLQDLKISQSSQPPLPSSSPLNTHGDWETHKDQNGRHFYYNRATQERTWKPPRARESKKEERHDTASTETEVFSSEENCLSSQSDSQYGSPPRGWSEELDEYGHTLYVCDHTNEKWIKHVDELGRPYYYSADGSRSEWELPKVNIRTQSNPSALMPKTGDTSKTRSLDRRQPTPIVLEWRHSTCTLEANDKEPPKAGTPDSDCSDPSSPKHPHSPSSERSGFLNVTKITEQGKKVRKNWSSSWAVLQGSLLIFAKNQGTATSWFGSHQSKPDFSIDLRGATVERASKDKSSKKHVLEVKTRQGTEILIQSDVENTINEWFKSLTEAINTHAWESDEAIEEDMPESPGPEKHDKEKEHRDSKKLRAMKNSTSMDSTEQKKTKKQLKKFLIRRPTLQAVRDKGYIKDQVFGCNLISLCQRENTTVPHFVRMCIDHVENHGLNLDGLYRVSGNLAIIQKLRFTVNHDEKINFEDSKWEDIHVITGALKMFFRELPEPLFTHTLFNDFVAAIKIPDYKQKVQAVKDKVQKLPRPNHDTMQALFKHLKKVIEHGEKNRMTTQSVAIVFGPTLLRPEIETLNMAVHMVYQNQIVELVLLEYDTMFGR
ncbi:rho GTPase-activating protein 12a isoform X4 [Pygocentrus nattereri]|uniref:rho GTPase-activating protein 12a isoform X4 n=1 Tax=Pygocentrus nattereri TaxID=42514 RepID=UPI001890C524|nr:rho GTPase-activating protein 12a isoform X4 [Pygocentrus nattereri]